MSDRGAVGHHRGRCQGQARRGKEPVFARLLIALIAIALAPQAPAMAQAQPYPNRPIKLIVPFAPGGPADTLARLAAQRLASGLKATIVPDNRPGAGGTLGAKAAASAEPDGYTLMFANTAILAVGPAVYASIGYDPLKAFAAVALISVTSNLLVVNPALPVNSVAALIAHARA